MAFDPKNLTGFWYAQGDKNKPCSIEFEGGQLTVRNEDPQSPQQDAIQVGNYTLRVPGWGELCGLRVAGTGTLYWENNSVWKKA